MALSPVEEWNRTSDANKEAIKEHFGEMELKPNMFVLVCKAHLETKETAPLDVAMMVTVLRDILGPFWFEEGELVKEDGDKFFCVCETVDSAAHMGLTATKKIEALRMGSPLAKILKGLSCGIAAGDVLLRPGPGGDLYGHPVQVALKLAEDIAACGETLIASDCLPAHVNRIDWPMPGASIVKSASCLISTVNIGYEALAAPKPDLEEHDELMRNLTEEETEDLLILRFLNQSNNKVSAEEDRKVFDKYQATATLVNISLKGFNDVQSKGLVQFLLLIAKEREVIKDGLTKHGGELVKFEGDYIVAKFNNELDALNCIVEVHEGLQKNLQNSPRVEKTFKEVTMCMGVEHGEMLLMGEDVFGWAWDVAYQLGNNLADSETQDILLGPKIAELAHAKWKAPAGITFEGKALNINTMKVQASRMYYKYRISDQEQGLGGEKRNSNAAAADGDMAAGTVSQSPRPPNHAFVKINPEAIKKAQESNKNTDPEHSMGLLCCCSKR